MGEYEVTLDGGGPWGMRLQGGKDFGVALNIARVNPGSKAENHGLVAGDQILAINGNLTENLTHNQAQNLIKGAGSRLSLKLKQGKGVSLGEIKQVGSGGFAAQPKQTIYQTETTHSAGVDHKFNAKPKAFGAANVGATTITARASAPSNVAVGKKFDPAEYARKKKEELEKYKEEKNNPKEIEEQSEVLKMLQNTSVDSNKGSGAGSFSRLQNQLDNEDETNGAPPQPDVAFRMTAESSDLYDVSPGSKKVMDDIRNRGTSGLSNQGASTGSRSFKLLQQMTDDADANLSSDLQRKMKEMSYEREILDRTASVSSSGQQRSASFSSCRNKQMPMRPKSPKTVQRENLPPPPPDMFEQEQEAPKNSGTFNSMQQQIDAGQGDQIKTVFSQPSGQRGQPVYAGAPVKKFNPPSYVSPTPKAPASSGPNFKVGRASAPTFKPSPISNQGNQRVAPPAVNAGEVQNPNSRMLGGGGNFSPPPTSPSYQPSMSPNQFNRPAASPTNQFNQPAATSPTNKYNRRPSDHTFQPNANNRGAPSYPANPPQQQQQQQQQGSQPAGRFSPSSSNPPSNMNQRVMNHSQPQPAPSPTSQKDLNCFACNQLLTGPFVSAIGKTWHPEHFCCSACNVSLQNQAFVEENNSLFCEKCYNHYYAPKCAHCNNAIIGNCINALGKSWHPDHFVCGFCNRSFGSDGFLVDSGKPYCEKCYEDLFSVKCGKCARPITGGEKYVEALNKNWHSECFSCNKCNVRLEGNSFFVQRGMPYCANHKSGV